MSDLLNRTAVNTAIDTLLNDAQPVNSILPSLHNGLLKDVLDTLANGIFYALRTNNETNGLNLEFTSGSSFIWEDSGFTSTVNTVSLTANRTINFPNGSGTLALTTDNTNLANTNLLQDVGVNRQYNMNNNDLTFLNGVFKVSDSVFTDVFFMEHGGGDISFGGVSGRGTGGSNWVHKNTQVTGAGVGTSTSWSHIDTANDQGIRIANWYTTGGINSYGTIEWTYSSGGLYILNLNDSIHLGAGNNVRIGYGTGTERPTTVELNCDASRFVSTGVFGGTGSTTFTDTSGTQAGIEYDANYHSTYSNRSLVDKEYVDLAVISASGGNVAVIRETDSGVPTYFSDLQLALDSCKTAGTRAFIQLQNNLTITSTINMIDGGTGSGNDYKYQEITIDFNGFSIWNSQNNTTGVLNIDFGSTQIAHRTLKLMNGELVKTIGDGIALNVGVSSGTANYGNLVLENMLIYSQTWHSAIIKTRNTRDGYIDWGNSVFQSLAITSLRLSLAEVKNFQCLTDGTQPPLKLEGNSGKAKDFKCVSTATGNGLQIGAGWDVSDFEVKAQDAIGISCDSNWGGTASNFEVRMNNGEGIHTYGTTTTYAPLFQNFKIFTGDNYGIVCEHDNTRFDDFYIENNSSSMSAVQDIGVTTRVYSNGVMRNLGSSAGYWAYEVDNIKLINVDIESYGGTGSVIRALSGDNVKMINCNFESKNNSATNSHSMRIDGATGQIDIADCNFIVANSSNNNIYSATSKTIRVRNSDFRGASVVLDNIILNTAVTTDAFGNTNY